MHESEKPIDDEPVPPGELRIVSHTLLNDGERTKANSSITIIR